MSTFGRVFRVTTFGESHCKSVGVVIDGVPPGLELSEADLQPQLDRRRPGQSAIATARQEADRVEILSGTERGRALGTPFAARVNNNDQRPGDYAFQGDEAAFVPRPSHADYTYRLKYGIAASSGGGRASARETIGRVIAGAVAEKALRQVFPEFRVVAWVSAVGPIEFDIADPKYGDWQARLTREEVDATMVRCPDRAIAEQMQEYILRLAGEGDSTGGVVSCIIHGVPAGLGEPCFDKLEALLAHAMLSVPATKGFEVGSGFGGTRMRGSEHNDAFVAREGGRLGTATNHSGGIQGGIANGEAIPFRVAFKPPATIARAQQTANLGGAEVTLAAKGRHDPCVVNRAVPIVEAMAALTVMDAYLLQKTRSA